MAVLLDAADHAGADVSHPTPGQRFACAFLWAQLDAEGRETLREYWGWLHEARQWPSPDDAGAAYLRGTYARTQVTGLSRHLGMSQSPAAWQALRDMGRG